MKLTSPKCNQADILWRKTVRSLFSNKCMVCRKQEPEYATGFNKFECHHILGRSAWVRWRIENGMLLCKKHHQRRHETADGKQWLDEIISYRFPSWFAIIEEMKRIKPSPFTARDLEQAVAALKDI